MADDNNKDKERIKLLEEQNRLYKKQLDLQEEGYSLSTSYVESLKEVLGIRSKLSTSDDTLLSLNKKINKEIINQKVEYENIADVQKQIKKNNDLIEKAQKLERGLANSITTERQKQVDKTARAFQLQNDLSKSIEDAYKKLEEGKQVNLDILKSKEAQLVAVEKETNRRVELLSSEEKKLLYTKLQQEELQKQNIEREKEKKALENVNKSLGVAGALMKGISKIPFLGDLPGMNSVMKEVEAEVKKINALREKEGEEPLSRAEALKITFSKMGGVIKNSLTDPLVVGLFVLKQLYDAFTASDKATGDLAKNFNITYDEAINLRNELISIGNASGDVALNARALQESMVAIGKTLGSNAMLNEADLKTFTKLREQAGFTNEELIELEKITLATGGNLEDNAKNLMFAAKTTALNNKVLLNEKDIMRDVAKASDAVKLSLAGNPEALGKAAAQAKALGMSLEQVDKIADSILDFESSINNELSAELITGRQLNLEQARLYAINNDLEGLSRELAKNFGTAAEFSKMNRIQQEAAAKAVGMSREELAKALTDQEALKGLSGEQAQAAQSALDAARAKGMSEEEIAKQGIDNLMKQQSVQERLNNSIEKMKEIFVSIAGPIMEILSPLVDILNSVLGPILKILQPIFGIFKAIAAIISGVIKFVTGDFSGSMNAFKSIGSINWFSSGSEPKKFADGGIVTKPINNATVGEAGPEAIIPLNSSRAGNIINGISQPTQTTVNVPQPDFSPLLNELKALRQEQAKANSKPTVIENSMNGSKFGTSVTVNTYKTQ